MANILETLAKWLNRNETREIPSSENLFWLMKQIKNNKIVGEIEDDFGNSARATSGERRFTDPGHTTSTYGSCLEVNQLVNTRQGDLIINTVFDWLEINPKEIDLSLSIGPDGSNLRTINTYRIFYTRLNSDPSNPNEIVFKKENSNSFDNRFNYVDLPTRLPDSAVSEIINKSYKIAFNLFLRKGGPIPLDPIPTTYKSSTTEFPIHTNGKFTH